MSRKRIAVIALPALIVAAGLSSAKAVQEPTAWQLLDDGDPDPNVSWMVYDSARARAVLMAYDVWELVGEDWKRRFTGYPPFEGGGKCFAYDAGRNVTVALASDTDGSLAETWEYDGSSWVQRTTASSPSQRIWCQMVYDSARQRVVLFGGHMLFTTSGLNDTWEYDGTNWTRVTMQTNPGARGEHGLAYDSGRERVVLFGGTHNATTYGDTWEYDGHRWRQKSPSTSPSPRRGPGMAYDSVRQKTVLFGGARSQDLGDTWEWDGTNWTQKAPVQSPAPRNFFGMAYHDARGQVILEGGQRDNGDFNDTWAYDGSNWQQIAVSGLPTVRRSFALANDSALEATVLYGGNSPNQLALWDTWHLNAGTWAQQSGAGSPSVTYSFQLAYEPTISGLVGFSGSNGSVRSPDRHDYAGSPRLWSDVGGGVPNPRYDHGWTSAPPLGGILMFGGWACCTGGSDYYADDTWTLEGSTWRLHMPVNRPAGRWTHGLAFDSARGKAVLYGGVQSNILMEFADTWLYDGQDWQLVFQNSAPGPRSSLSLAFDEARGVSVLYGDGVPKEGVTWEFDGVSWSARPTPFQPDTDRCYTPITYDPKRKVVLLFGGGWCESGSRNFNDTWAYGPDPDGDGIVGGLDNCRIVANASQANSDGDAAGDACDCAPANGGVFAVPAEVTNLRLAADEVTASWDSAAPGAGSATVHDVLKGSIADLPVGGVPPESCLASGIPGTTTTDPAAPLPGTGFWYLVRGRNACGASTYGTTSDGSPRNSTSCP